MAYNPNFYQNQFGNNNYQMYSNPNLNALNTMNQPYYSQMATPPPILSAAYTKGEIGASSYPVVAGNTVVLLDSDTIDTDNPIIYIKTTGYDGKPQTIKKITGSVSYPNEQGLFTVPVQEIAEQPQVDLTDYVKQDEINVIKEYVDTLSTKLENFEGAIQNINESLNNIDNRFSNMFSAFSGNSSNNTSFDNSDEKEKETQVTNNYSNNKKFNNKKGGSN